MACDEDLLEKALAELNLVASGEFRLKPEQEVVVNERMCGRFCRQFKTIASSMTAKVNLY